MCWEWGDCCEEGVCQKRGGLSGIVEGSLELLFFWSLCSTYPQTMVSKQRSGWGGGTTVVYVAWSRGGGYESVDDVC